MKAGNLPLTPWNYCVYRLEKRNFDLHEAMEKQRKKLERDIEKLKRAVESTKVSHLVALLSL